MLNIRVDVKNAFDEDFCVTLSPRKTFRNRIYPLYKAKRKPRSKLKSDALNAFMKEYWEETIVHEDFEADDITVFFMLRGSKVLAIDKDIVGVRTQHVFNYNQKRIYQPQTKIEAERFTVYQSMMGDSTDGIPGAQGIGKGTAKKMMEAGIDIYEWAQLFKSIEEAELAMQLVRMDQIDKNIKLKLWRLEDWCLV